MKHLLAKEHHPHLKKRAILELVGLGILLLVSFHQRELIQSAFETIRTSDLLYVFLMLAIYWLMLPLTPISYKLLSQKKMKIRSTMLAQLAGSGPGRIIPGGLGHLSISTVHLHKIGLHVQAALAITVTNNVIGLLVNVTMVTIVLLSNPTLISYVNDATAYRTLLVLVVVALLFATIFLWLTHIRSTKKMISKLELYEKKLCAFLTSHPKRFASIIGISIVITSLHTTLILLAAKAIGVDLQPAHALLALSSGIFIGGVIPSPGGLGVVEAGMAGSIILLGYDPTQAVSISLLYRMATYWQPLLPGIFAYLYLRKRKLL
jgi:undecaprenyl-diphosphatase